MDNRNNLGIVMREMKTYFYFGIIGVALLYFSSLSTCVAQVPGYEIEPSKEGDKPSGPVVVEELAPPVIINGKRADELTDDEKREFLQDKIKNIVQGDTQVEIIHVAPAYPVTISFQEAVTEVIIGDDSMLSVQVVSDAKMLYMRALAREGDTPVQVIFSGGKMRLYHVLVSKDYSDADSVIRVAAFDDNSPNSTKNLGWLAAAGMNTLDIRTITQIIRNYDALVGERAINNRMVKRIPIFRKSNITSFTTYYLYQFSSDPAAITFAYQNPYPYPIRYDESRLRIAIGNVRYVPDYVSFHKQTLAPGETTTGFAVIARPAFRFNQPFELVWK